MTPPNVAAQLIVTLARGKADALLGCFISIHHDLEAMIQQAERIRTEELYLMRVQTL